MTCTTDSHVQGHKSDVTRQEASTINHEHRYHRHDIEIFIFSYYFLKEKLTVKCYKPLGYITRDTRTLISQCDVDKPIENNFAGAIYSRNRVDVDDRKCIIVNIFYIIVNIELNNMFINAENVNIQIDSYFVCAY